MLFVEHTKPSPELATYVYGYVQRISVPNRPDVIEPVVARSGSMLEFQFGDPYDVPAYGVDLPNPSVPITVIGPMPARHVRLVIRGRVEALAVLFRPLGWSAIFKIPLAPLVGTGTEAVGVLGRGVNALYQQMGNMRSFSERVKMVEAFLVCQLQRRGTVHSAHRALHVIASGRSGLTVQQAASQAGISTRQLERVALEYFGITPVLLVGSGVFNVHFGCAKARKIVGHGLHMKRVITIRCIWSATTTNLPACLRNER